jgi:hypothetical protein
LKTEHCALRKQEIDVKGLISDLHLILNALFEAYAIYAVRRPELSFRTLLKKDFNAVRSIMLDQEEKTLFEDMCSRDFSDDGFSQHAVGCG